MTPEFERAWQYLEPAVVARGEHTKESVWAAIANGRCRLWSMPNSALIGSIFTYPTGLKAGLIWLAGGDLQELLDWGRGEGPEFAKFNGCHEVRLDGRRGWLRTLKQDGYHELGTTLVKKLDV
jgi:hypothetical protein